MNLNWNEVDQDRHVARGQRYAYAISWKVVDDYMEGPPELFLEITDLDTGKSVAAPGRATDAFYAQRPPYMRIGESISELKARAEAIERDGIERFTYSWIDQKRRASMSENGEQET